MPQFRSRILTDGIIEIDGIVEEIIFQNTENGYTVFDFSTDDELSTAVGFLSDVQVGESIKMFGSWKSHPNYGRQFSVETFERKIIETAAEMLRYLSSGTIKGIGAKTATKIVERFGERTFDVIENYPEELALMKGISFKKATEISDEFKKKVAVRETIIALERYDMKPSECLAAYNAFGNNAIEKIRTNPFVLCSEEVGFSFSRADEISALVEGDFSVFRKRAGIVSVLRRSLAEGHTCLPRRLVLEPAARLLDSDADEIDSFVSDLISDRVLLTAYVENEDYVFLPEFYHAERNIADRMNVYLQFPPPSVGSVEKDIEIIENTSSIKFEEKQKEAIRIAVEKGLLILTGGPGTGKTTTLNGIIEIYENLKLKVLLAAPTGRAAKRISDVTGREAKTLHRLLEVTIGKNNRSIFNRNAQNPLECDAVVVDELSMVDVTLFWGLLDALPLGCRLIMVGDSDQLPPVGAGNVLRDIIDSGIMPVVALNEIFRQAKESLIVTNAHKIVSGQRPELDAKDKDFFFLERNSTSSVAALISDLFLNRLPSAYGYNSIEDIQILCPSRKGELGTTRLNQSLQKMINPPEEGKSECSFGGITFRVDDKVMQNKNNYDIPWTNIESGRAGEGVFNGDIGIIRSVNTRERSMKILFDDRLATYPFESLGELELAYAVTVHKSQGCEFECVLMPVFNVNPHLAYRNLLYTAVTRAKTRIILAGTRSDVYRMAENDQKARRYSALKYFIAN